MKYYFENKNIIERKETFFSELFRFAKAINTLQKAYA
jgi:hypothetical protein